MLWQSLIIIVIITLSTSRYLYAIPVIQWAQIYSGFDPETRTSGRGFRDVYINSEGNYLLCGEYGTYKRWLMKVDNAGNVSFDLKFRGSEGLQVFRSVIETDNSDIVTVGYDRGENGGDASVLRVNNEGEEQWHRYMGGNGNQGCYAVIELKDGDFLLAGYTTAFDSPFTDAYLVKIEENGDRVWERHYGISRRSDMFCAIREVNGGYLLAGRYNSTAWLFKVDENGDEIWSQTYSRGGNQSMDEVFTTLISDPEGGFLAAGHSTVVPDMQSTLMIAVRVDDDGEIIWQHLYEPYGSGITCVVKEPVDGFILVGEIMTGSPAGVILKINNAGNLTWSHSFDPNGRPIGVEALYSVLMDSDGGIIAAGLGTSANNRGGMLLKFVPERSAPQIIEYYPETLEFNLLQHDSMTFVISAIDAQDDSLAYFFLLERDTVGYDSSVTLTFNDLDVYFVTGIAFDGDLADSIVWTVNVREMFIAASTPDSLNLTLRRGARVDFAIDSVAKIEGLGEPSYAWRLFDYEAERWDSVGTDSAVSILFDRTGRFGVEAMAYIEDASDSVHWNVNVRGVIRSYLPVSDNLTVTPGSSITFELDPFNPQSDSLVYRWTFDGDELAGDSARLPLRFDIIGRYEIVGYAFEGAEADSQRWEVNVARPDGVDEFGIKNYDLRFGVSPNPFNSITDVQYNLPKMSDVSLRLYDINGREIMLLLDEKAKPAGSYTIMLDGRSLPAGLYFARLTAGREVRTVKLLLMR